MEPIDSNQIKSFGVDMSIQHSPPLGDTIESGIFGEPEIFPRIGEEYQAQLPELLDELGYVSHAMNPENTSLGFWMGQPIPLMAIFLDGQEKSGVPPMKGSEVEEEQENLRKIQVHLATESSEVKTIPSDVKVDNGTASGGLADVSLAEKLQDSRDVGLSLVPGSASNTWNDAEKASFLLGLYIFEKNFVRVTRFVESKKKGDVLAFYYGKFYRSPEYYRWSECRKMRSRRSVFGQKIFTGMRLQELLSRILQGVSEECKRSLMEVSKVFGEGKLSFEEYVFSLKAMVGMSALVEAVGIGKGKQDLTGMALEPLRSNHVIPMRPEIPTGKACSALTAIEIVKFLTGDYRLSKARSNDLFWEAVWPRLLARGWHSEEPKDQVYAAGSKNSLVFLIPGIKKFSRRRLVRGNHYFDSVTDVLNKVASEPGLIELDNDEDQSKKNKEEHDWDDAKLEEDDTPSRRRQYLQPRTPNRTADGMKFTVVDTSLGDGKPYKVRELRSLPFEIPNKLNSRSCVEVNDEDTSEDSTNGSDDTDTVLPDKNESEKVKASNSLSNGELVADGKALEVTAAEQEMHTDSPNVDGVQVNDSRTHSPPSADKQPKKMAKHQLSRSMKEDNLDNIAPVTKRRRRLPACSRVEIRTAARNPYVALSGLGEMPTCSPAIHNSPSQAVSSEDKLPLTSSARDNPSGAVDCAPLDNCHTEPQDGPQSQTLIDLNIPQVPVDFEHDILMTDAIRESDEKSRNIGSSDVSRMAVDMTSSDQQSSVNPQRRSTRNRPPTPKALEALANGFLTVSSRRKKTKEDIPRESSASRSSRLSRVGMESTEVSPNSVDPMAEGSNRDESTLAGLQKNGPPCSSP